MSALMPVLQLRSLSTLNLRNPMNLRESFAATHHASLEWSPISERAIDKVAASGLCDPLGVLLWKARYMLESWAYKQAEQELKLRIRVKFPREVGLNLDKVIEQSLKEFMSDKCLSCNGRASVTINNLKITCEACSGSGIRRYTDFERARYTKLALGRIRTLQRHFNWTTDLMMTLEGTVNAEMYKILGRRD